LVGIAVAAGPAVPAPHHFLHGHSIAHFESLPFRARTDFHDFAGELVADYRRKLGKAGIKHIAIFIGLVKVDIGAADPTSLHAQENLSRSGFGLGDLARFQFRIAPNTSALNGLAGFPLELCELVTRPWFPFGASKTKAFTPSSFRKRLKTPNCILFSDLNKGLSSLNQAKEGSISSSRTGLRSKKDFFAAYPMTTEIFPSKPGTGGSFPSRIASTNALISAM